MKERSSFENAKKLKALKNDGSTKNVLINEAENKFSQGRLGEVRYADIKQVDGANSYQGSFVVKEYKAFSYPAETAKERVAKALQAYRLLQDAGVTHVPTTVRSLEPGGTQLVMTNFNAHGYVALGEEAWNEERYEKRLDFHKPEDIQPMLRELYDEVVRLTDHGIAASGDSYFILLPVEEGKHLQFVLGDLDNVREYEEPEQKGELFRYNFERSLEFMRNILSRVAHDRATKHETLRIFDAWWRITKNDRGNRIPSYEELESEINEHLRR